MITLLEMYCMAKNFVAHVWMAITVFMLDACDSQFTQFEIFAIDPGGSHVLGSPADSFAVKHFLLDGHIDLTDTIEVREKIIAYIAGNEKETIANNKGVELMFYTSPTGFDRKVKNAHNDLNKAHDPYLSLIYRNGNLYSSAFYDGKKMLGVSYEFHK
jgi:hypothetical protein